MVTFDGNGVIEKQDILLNDLECSFENVAIERSGDYMLLKDRRGNCFLLDLDQKSSGLSEICEEECADKRDGMIDLKNEGIFLDMGSYGVFGKWCQ